MRELIEFRGWNNIEKWVYGYLISDSYILKDRENYEHIMSETLGEYTGKLDKKKTRIFTNDIVKANSSDYDTGIIKLDEEQLTYIIDYIYHDEYDLLWQVEDIEVIGNVFDNPELLEANNEL